MNLPAPLASEMTQSKRPKPSRAERRSTRRATPAAVQPDKSPDESPDQSPAVNDSDIEEPPAYTIDELTATTGIPSRTIRFYQSSGVLPKPDKRGRIAYYGPQHVERLELIGTMQDRGLRMRAIKDLVGKIDAGEVVLNEWLGLEEQLSSAWVDDAPKVLTRAQLDELLGPRRPGFIAELARHGLLEAQTENAYLVHSPGLLRIAVGLDDGGVAIEVATGASEILQKHLSKAARELVGFFAERAGDGFGKDETVAGISEAFRELRGLGQESVRLIFAREMEQTLRKLVETGEATRLDKKKRRRSKRG